MSRLRRGPGSGGARPPRRGEAVGGWRGWGWGGGQSSPPSLPRHLLLPKTLLRAAGGSRAGPAGAPHAGLGAGGDTTLPLRGVPVSPSPAWPCRAGRTLLRPCRGVGTRGRGGDTQTQRQRGRSHPKTGRGEGKVWKVNALPAPPDTSPSQLRPGRGCWLEKWLHVGV